MTFQHTPVLLKEIVSFVPESSRLIIDFTLGGANHAAALLNRYPDAFLHGIDRDLDAIEAGNKKLNQYPGRFKLKHSSFSDAIQLFKKDSTKADFILADLGVSSNQLLKKQRGFSFRQEGPLDMRMNTEDSISAADIINTFDEAQLEKIIRVYGEERFARKIAKNIVTQRQEKQFKTTLDLTECIVQSIPMKYQFGKIHAATKTFQAIRIQVNKELYELENLLENALDLLKSKGRLAIISFHSLEDRPIKQQFRKWEDPCTCPKKLPVCVCGLKPLAKNLSRKVIKASPEEMKLNVRSRSARLRIIEKI